MTDEKLTGLKEYNSSLNHLVKESLEEALVSLMKVKDFNQITICELCKKAGVSRMAFYNNFRTLEALLESTILSYSQKLVIDKIGSPFRENTDINWYIVLFEGVKKNSELLYLMFKSGFTYKYLSIVNSLVLHRKTLTDTEKYFRLIWAGGIVNIIIYWLNNGMKESIESLAEFCVLALPYNFEPTD